MSPTVAKVTVFSKVTLVAPLTAPDEVNAVPLQAQLPPAIRIVDPGGIATAKVAANTRVVESAVADAPEAKDTDVPVPSIATVVGANAHAAAYVIWQTSELPASVAEVVKFTVVALIAAPAGTATNVPELAHVPDPIALIVITAPPGIATANDGIERVSESVVAALFGDNATVCRTPLKDTSLSIRMP